MIRIKCTQQEQEDICRCLAAERYCAAHNPDQKRTCWKCKASCVKEHIEWEITDES